MTKGNHPNVQRREAPADDGTKLRALVYVVDPARAEWVEAELADEPITVQVARSVEQVVSALVEDPPPRAQLFVLDVDSIAPVDLLQLHQIRERGWFGAIIALGQVPAPLRSSLAIAHVLMPPLRKSSLRNTIARAGIVLPTTKMPKIGD